MSLPTLQSAGIGTKCDFCAWDGVELTMRHSYTAGVMRREMISLWDDQLLNEYADITICAICRWYLIHPREHMDWIIDSQRRGLPETSL